MWPSGMRSRDPARAWHITVLTFIVLFVGCSKPKTQPAPPKSNATATTARAVAQSDVDAAQHKLDEIGAAVTKTEAALDALRQKAKLSEEEGQSASSAAARVALGKEIATTEGQLADQRAELEKATKELTERKFELQKVQSEATSQQNNSDRM